MAGLARWKPFEEMLSLRERMDRLFDELWRDPFFSGWEVGRTWAPALDFSETKDDYIVRLEAPGVKQGDIEVTLQNNVLTIQGKRERSEEHKDETVHRVERVYGSFSRSLTIPSGVKVDDISATYKDGILEIRLPKSEESKPKKIELKSA
ncbi:MAG: Hsp20/alpha crystallin family protein [Abditibacteriales bacterium]|nr:Hsp20/alpha crystallin family protein [Abditibacteriales bacterium]MDW8365535.1 Hsp20/alpha crystallin family protein [Abditibacteriales bacterium]